MRIKTATEGGMLALKGDLAEASLPPAVFDVVSASMPERGCIIVSERATLLWMAPDELLFLVDVDAAADLARQLRQATGDIHALVEDVSDMRVTFTLDGPEVRDVLARVTPADVSPAALPPGRVRRTRVGQVAAAFWLAEEGRAELLCFRSVADYVLALLEDAAASEPLGLYHVDG